MNRAGTFSFNKALNAGFLHELFAGDLAYAAEVFADVSNELQQSWAELETAYLHSNSDSLKAAAHKCKTLFAYVGHDTMQQRMQEIETAGSLAPAGTSPHECWHQLQLDARTATQLILDETERLKEFHACEN